MEEASQGIRPLIEEIIQQFPGVTTAFAYGSGVFHQHGYSSKDVPMIDLVFGVKHSAQWHRDNIAAHPSHYSSVRHFGPKIIELLQDRIGAGLYYNTLVRQSLVSPLRHCIVTCIAWNGKQRRRCQCQPPAAQFALNMASLIKAAWRKT